MKINALKFLSVLFFLLTFTVQTAYASYNYSRIPSENSTINNPVTFEVTFDSSADMEDASGGDYWWIVAHNRNAQEIDPDLVGLPANMVVSDCELATTLTTGPHSYTLPAGNYNRVRVVGGTLAECINDTTNVGNDTSELAGTLFENTGADPSFTIELSSGGGGGDSGTDLGAMISMANVGFATTTGFDIPAVVSWAGDNLIKLFIGSGMAVLYGLRYWLIAIAVIGGIIYFSYRAFLFFRH